MITACFKFGRPSLILSLVVALLSSVSFASKGQLARRKNQVLDGTAKSLSNDKNTSASESENHNINATVFYDEQDFSDDISLFNVGNSPLETGGNEHKNVKTQAFMPNIPVQTFPIYQCLIPLATYGVIYIPLSQGIINNPTALESESVFDNVLSEFLKLKLNWQFTHISGVVDIVSNVVTVEHVNFPTTSPLETNLPSIQPVTSQPNTSQTIASEQIASQTTKSSIQDRSGQTTISLANYDQATTSHPTISRPTTTQARTNQIRISEAPSGHLTTRYPTIGQRTNQPTGQPIVSGPTSIEALNSQIINNQALSDQPTTRLPITNQPATTQVISNQTISTKAASKSTKRNRKRNLQQRPYKGTAQIPRRSSNTLNTKDHRLLKGGASVVYYNATVTYISSPFRCDDDGSMDRISSEVEANIAEFFESKKNKRKLLETLQEKTDVFKNVTSLKLHTQEILP
eukprot:CAMPEP_0195529570 /NCGR_PEP_ID=MMETSP0794_2-20130614/32168_1 /TAXON_ID=515487 /ORGANISM="Stephanopyxis turris, Strain CCMP 815" /LENGTH=459 /DNA_ID=CAMNT_0040660893 /DNA_START=19 /DNA_END=1398 /DNA_ORIENTATION=-